MPTCEGLTLRHRFPYILGTTSPGAREDDSTPYSKHNNAFYYFWAHKSKHTRLGNFTLCCKVLTNLKYYKLINYNWNCCCNQKYTKVISTKLSPKYFQHNSRYMLYLWAIVLQCTWVLCCGVCCCMLCYTAHSHCNPYTPLHQTGRTPVDRTTTTKHNKDLSNPWVPSRIPGHAQGITDRTYWGPSYMLRHALSLYIPHSL